MIEAIDVINDRRQPYYQPHRKPNLSFFSRSNLECLDWAHEHCRRRSFGEISDEKYAHEAWKKAGLNGHMSFQDMLIGADDEIIKEAEAFAAHGVL